MIIISAINLPSCYAASSEDIASLLGKQRKILLKDGLSDGITIERINSNFLKLSKLLPESIDPYAFKVNKDGSFEDI